MKDKSKVINIINLKLKQIKDRISKKNRQLRLYKIKKKIKNTEVRSIICNNCVGAMVLNDFGLKFNSPFVNLFISAPDYIRLLKNLRYYCDPTADIMDISSNSSYPKGLLRGEITLHFLHYHSFEEAVEKWRTR